jgi:hypothetical protein
MDASVSVKAAETAELDDAEASRVTLVASVSARAV